jgi:hypothetical protein
MNQVPQIDEIKISPEDWALTPVRIQQVIERLGDFLQRSYRFEGAQGFAPLQSCW